ncbi:NlpC/P60 family protein [Streptomyces sp. NPDC060000]|uniref:C40 family peptidase n=1 Tax=Streptomyces sp. NPDC060000 TaxID=3347031 RepID=UPI0036CFCBB8
MATDRSPRSPGNIDEPSRAEIQQRVNSLYDRAESDTGTYNMTRARSSGTRRAVTSVANSGRGSADPSLEAVARQWFDVARDRVGPTVPAVLPNDRQPARPARPARQASAPERSAESTVARELEAATRRVPELTARAVPALPAAPEPRPEELRALLPAVPSPAAAPSPARAEPSASAPADRQASLKNSKEQIGRKLSTAREVLARALAQPMQSLPMQSPPMQSLPAPVAPMQSLPAPVAPMPSLPAPVAPMPSLAMPSLPTSSLPVTGAQPAESQPVQQPWDTAEQQAFRAEITAAWAGRPPTAAPGTASPTGSEGLLTAGEPGFGAPASGFTAAEVAFTAAAPGYPAPDLGVTTPPYGYPISELGLTAPESGLTAPGLIAPGAGPVAAVAAPGYPASELGFITPPSGYATSELPLAAPESAYATPGFAPSMPSAPMPSHQAPMGDLLTGGTGYPSAPAVTVLTAPAAPLPEVVAPAAAPADVTVSATGTAYLGKADKALAFARAQIGRPCVWGATGPESYDCSSLTQAAWRTAGVTLPRSAIDQAKAFTRISLAELRPGDLVFFFDDLSHTGLCTGNGMMIHAPGPGAYIREEAILPFGEGALRGAVRPA